MDKENRHAQRAVHSIGADTVVVFIHGILGSPAQFDSLFIQAIGRGYSAVSVLLPGHGGSAAFHESNATQWLAYVYDQIGVLSKRYVNILLVGHSMGGLLAIHTALKYPESVKRLFCIALPLHLKLSLRSIRMSLVFMLRRADKSSNRFIQAALAACSVTPDSVREYIRWLPNFIGLSSLTKKTRAALGTLQTKIVICFCAKDESVAYKSIRTARKGLTQCVYELCVLPHAGHFLFSDSDTALLHQRFSAFLQES